MTLWWPRLFPVRPELVLKAGMPAWGASGVGNATTMMVEPVSVRPQIAATGAAPGRVSLAFLAAGGDGRRPAQHAPARSGLGLPPATRPPTWCETAAPAPLWSTPPAAA